MKRKWMVTGITILMLCSLFGCSDSGADTYPEDEMQSEAYQEWVTDDSLSENEKNEREWDSQCQSLKDSLGALEDISEIEVSPADYATYAADGNVTITCTLSQTAQPEAKGEIKAFIDSTNMFDKYELEFK